jgi:hypothetical protein
VAAGKLIGEGLSMRGAGMQLALNFGASAGAAALSFGEVDSEACCKAGSESDRDSSREAERDETVRLVEFAPFPRVQRGQHWQHGVTVDLSPRGLCVRAQKTASIGSLLRVLIRSVDGMPALDCVARVVWSEHRPAGAPRMGLAVVASRPSKDIGREPRTVAVPPVRVHRSAGLQAVPPAIASVRGAEHGAAATTALAS